MRIRLENEFDRFFKRTADAAAVTTADLLGIAPREPQSAYHCAIRYVLSIITTLILDSRGIAAAGNVADELRSAAGGGDFDSSVLSQLGESVGLSLLNPSAECIPSKTAASETIRIILQAPSLDTIYFGSIPAQWLSSLYERLIDLKPRIAPGTGEVELVTDSGSRKKSGSFFTPPYIVDFIVSDALGKSERPASSRVLDPSTGAGNFLLKTLRYLTQRGCSPAHVAENCLYGCDIDPIAVDVCRFLIWLETNGTADAATVSRHILHTDVLSSDEGFRWQDMFSDVFNPDEGSYGFDTVIGNPPYLAAKNKMLKHVGTPAGIRGQSDSYLLFLESILDNELVRPGGRMSMVLPDPFLVRGNASRVRRALLKDWTVESIIHISGAFPSAQVANIVLSCTYREPNGVMFPVVRVDRTDLRRVFELDPRLTVAQVGSIVSPKFALAQPKAEVLYLTVDDGWDKVFHRIHGPGMSISNVAHPYTFLKDINIDVIFRGEEIGKSAISATGGDRPILMGGESIRPYKIEWEGRHISEERIQKPLEWYEGEKILIQKSSAKLVAAFDTEGFVVPQSIYGVKLLPGSYHPLYLLALLNSGFMNQYVYKVFTGYKLVQPQIELEDVKRLPIRSINFATDSRQREELSAEGCRIFEHELTTRAGDFPELIQTVQGWLADEKEDVVHDLLVHVCGMAVRSRRDGDDSILLAGRIDAAIDSLVELLYA